MPPPRLGEHNGEVLNRLLGYDEAQVAELQKEGIL
jgi:crotonobetainyl-CoA:carnitine CoA-transferase CaiB-like acyl-CoA transferase